MALRDRDEAAGKHNVNAPIMFMTPKATSSWSLFKEYPNLRAKVFDAVREVA
jgi:hypothetical protein